MGSRFPSVLLGEEDNTAVMNSPSHYRRVQLPGTKHCGCTQQPSECPLCRREREDLEEAAALERLRKIGALR